MSNFTGPLIISFNEDGRQATLYEDLSWDLDQKGSGKTVTVPQGFVSDGATVPKCFWWLMPPWGDKGTRAAILHDYLLEIVKKNASIFHVVSREDCDWQFYLALKALGVGELRARILWLGVSAYSFYHRHLGVYLGLILP